MKTFAARAGAAALLSAGLIFTGPHAEGRAVPVYWKKCTGSYLRLLDCADLQVPLDYTNPTGTMITVALDRARHTGNAKEYQGVLLVNPGGPGGSGRNYGADVAAALPAKLRRAYDVIGFDPRGVGGSRPALSCMPGYFKPVRPDYVPGNNVKVWLERSKAYAEACGRKYGPVLDHMKTTDVVSDMDAIRAALGAKKINFYGGSYGTYLGAVYATVYPTRVRRMVLDSNVRPSGTWYGANLDQDTAFNASVKSFFGWIARYDSIYHLGRTEAAVERAYYALRAKLAKSPAAGVVGADELDDTIQIGGYLAPAWPMLAKAWSDYTVKKDAGSLLDRYRAWGAGKEKEFAVYNAVQCTDAQWPKDWQVWKADAQRIDAKAPYLVWGNTWFNAPCLYWPAKPGTPVAITSRKGLPPVLLLQATLDAATPYQGGVEMHGLLEGSRLVIEDGGRTHVIALRGNRCIDRIFEDYLATGRLPADRTHCQKVPDPVPIAPSRRLSLVGVEPMSPGNG